jgi:DNA mismatch repair protein MutS
MAGMPHSLTDRANEILAILEEKHADNAPVERIKKMPARNFQLNIFDGLGEDLRLIKTQLYAVDINTLTPVEALLKLNELKDIVKSYQ